GPAAAVPGTAAAVVQVTTHGSGAGCTVAATPGGDHGRHSEAVSRAGTIPERASPARGGAARRPRGRGGSAVAVLPGDGGDASRVRGAGVSRLHPHRTAQPVRAVDG